ncbi:MAG: TIGR04563 family protein [Polyangiaceae bacterium]
MASGDKDSIPNLRTTDSKTDKRKQSLYFPESMLTEIKEEAARLDRSLSWVVQRAWKISRLEIKKLPSVNEVDGDDDDDG